MSVCPCGSELEFENCCGPFLKESKKPETAEALMRARYSAFTLGNITFIKKTLSSDGQVDFDEEGTKKWAMGSKWHGLKILKTKKGQPEDKTGVVEFVATYEQEGELIDHHEVSQFKRNSRGEWIFVDGDAHTHKGGEGHLHQHEPIQTFKREEEKQGRNDPCACGSGKKFKKCHGAA